MDVKKRQKGITLISLVVTIVVLLILAGITISTVFSDNGIIKKAQEARNKTLEAVAQEHKDLNQLYNDLEAALNLSLIHILLICQLFYIMFQAELV